MQRPLTQKLLREYVRQLGGTLKKTDYDDYVVKLGGCEYYTTDLDDVLGTARAIAGTHPDRAAAERLLIYPCCQCGEAPCLTPEACNADARAEAAE